MTQGVQVVVLGFGQLGQAVTAGVAAAGMPVRVWNRRRPDVTAEVLADRVAAVGAVYVEDFPTALATAEVVIACVPGSAALEMARRSADVLALDAVYVDASTSAPAAKILASEIVGAGGGAYVDLAVLGSVAALGSAVPMIGCGPGARRFAALAEGMGLEVTEMAGAPGSAARVKLIRSVFLKGRDALVAEMLLAAHAEGVVDVVVRSIGGPAEMVSFEALSARVLTSLRQHAPRRAEELEAAAELLLELGVEPAAVRGATARLRLFEAGKSSMYDRDGDSLTSIIDALRGNSGRPASDAVSTPEAARG